MDRKTLRPSSFACLRNGRFYWSAPERAPPPPTPFSDSQSHLSAKIGSKKRNRTNIIFKKNSLETVGRVDEEADAVEAAARRRVVQRQGAAADAAEGRRRDATAVAGGRRRGVGARHRGALLVQQQPAQHVQTLVPVAVFFSTQNTPK